MDTETRALWAAWKREAGDRSDDAVAASMGDGLTGEAVRLLRRKGHEPNRLQRRTAEGMRRALAAWAAPRVEEAYWRGRYEEARNMVQGVAESMTRALGTAVDPIAVSSQRVREVPPSHPADDPRAPAAPPRRAVGVAPRSSARGRG